jgi:uncharacterized protein (TIGR01777 family)
MKVLVTGATGFVGKSVVRELIAAGDEVVVLTRNVAKGAIQLGNKCKYFFWDSKSVPPMEAFEGVQAIINLMGEGIADKRWTDEQKQIIHDSRINGTNFIIEAIKAMPIKPRVLVSASAIGIYGNRESEELSEDSSLGNDYLANLCKEWEATAEKAKAFGVRVAFMRTGVVLGPNGGALKKMLPIFKLGAGGPIGNGKQYMSWVHVDDLARMYVEVLKTPALQGPLNGTAPYPATSKEFAQTLGKTLGRPAFAPVPKFALKMVFGDMSSVLLDGQKVLPVKFKTTKFRFFYPTLEMALKNSAH